MALSESSGCDVRQIINVLQMARSSDKGMSDFCEESCNKDRKCMIGPFEAIWPMFSKADVDKTKIDSRLDLFFVDYSMVPMIVQENYLSYRPAGAKNIVDELEAASKAADSIAESDLVMPYIRGASQNWSLLPFYGVQSTVAPGYHMRCENGQGPRRQGWDANAIKFPGLLGKMSNANKRNRILRELQARTRHKASTPAAGMRQDYLPALRRMITKPLIDNGKEGISATIEAMNEYGINREDYDTLGDFMFKDDPSPMNQIATAVKTAFTRAWNQSQKDWQQVTKKGKKGAKSSAPATKAPMKSSAQDDEDDFIDDAEDDMDFMI